MSERLTSFFILSGGVLVLLVVWFLSVVIVQRDMRRRNAPETERKAWTAAAAALPLFGFALYLFVYVLRGYFSPSHGEPVESIADSADDLPGFTTQDAAMLSATGGDQPQEEVTPSTIPAGIKPVSGHYALFVSKGPHAGQMFELAPLPQRIGRGPDVTIALNADLNVSRSHAEIYEWKGLLRVRDLGSTHGTLINGVPVTDQSFNLGDHLSVGGTQLVLRELP